MKLLTIAALLAACSSPPKTSPDGRTCYWRNGGGGVQSTDGVCFRDGYALQCSFERDRTPQVQCATGCTPTESK